MAVVGVGVVQWAIGSALEETRSAYGWKWADVGAAALNAFAPIVHTAIALAASFIVGWILYALVSNRGMQLADSAASWTPAPSPHHTPLPAMTPQSTGRVFLPPETTAESLQEPLKRMTALQSSQLIESYLKKWITVEATLGDVAILKPGSHISVHLQNQPRLILRFGLDWHDRLKVMHRGQELRAVGQISDLDEYIVTLENCELI